MLSPCYHCERRDVGCRKRCPKWALYEADRRALYKQREIEMMARYNSKVTMAAHRSAAYQREARRNARKRCENEEN